MASIPHEWVILDGDNTLWDTESLYDQARSGFCAFLESMGFHRESVEHFQRARDTKLHETHGYSPARFPQSFVDTLIHFVGDNEPALESRVRLLGTEVFNMIAEPAPSLDEALQRLRGRFKLGLLTAGDKAVQTQRLQSFGRTGDFDAVDIVKHKDAATLQSFLDQHRIEPAVAWCVGDSIRSDIEPALALGVRAIHLDVANWHPVERGNRALPTGALQARSLLGVCELLGC